MYKDWEQWSGSGIISGLSLVTERSTIDEVPFLEEFVDQVSAPCLVGPWFNLMGSPSGDPEQALKTQLRDADQMRSMRRAAVSGGAGMLIYHEADDLRQPDEDMSWDDRLWEALAN